MENQLPEPTKIDADLFAKLKTIAEKQLALDAFVKKVMENGQSQMNVLNEQTRQVWGEIAARHNIDVRRIVWAPSNVEDGLIVPLQVQLAPQGP